MTHSFWRPFGATTLGLTLLLGTSTAFAQETTPVETIAVADTTQGSGQTYEPAYFEAYAPRTALDMVRQIPGFQISEGDNKRGLGQGGANILINGERLTGKTNPFDQLGRISATNVVKIEIVDGTSLDIPGLSGQVANITSKTTGISGTFEWNPEWRARLQSRLLQGEATISGENGNLAWSAKLESDQFRNGNRGFEHLFTPDGTIFEERYEKRRGNGQVPGASIDLKWTPREDHTGNLNLEYNQFNFEGQVDSARTALTPRGQNRVTQALDAEDEKNGSISGDYEFPFLSGKLKTIGYFRFEDSPSINQFDIYEFGSLINSGRFEQDADEGEAIARTEYSWAPKDGQDWQIGLEGAFNFLDIEQEFIENTASQFVDQFRVEEKRAELTVTHSRKLSPKWDLQVSAGGEYSEIAQTSIFIAPEDTAAPRDFFRPKGFITATYKPSDSLSIRTRAEREVGQLSFFDFISSVDLENDLGRDANPDLVPSQTWLGEVEFDKDFGQGNNLKVRFRGELISDLVDRIPIGVDGDAVGNIDSADRFSIDLDATIKGERWGFDGTELTVEADYRWSGVDDPLTGIRRRLNGDKKTYWFVEFRHDIPETDWAYGIAVDRYRQSKSFRTTTISQYDGEHPFGRAYIEHKDVFGLKVRGQVLNLFDASDNFDRQFFTARRDFGVLDYTEANNYGFDMFYQMSISGTF